MADSAKSQSIQAQSSGEAETYAGAAGTSAGMLIKEVMEFLNFAVCAPVLRMGSKVARSICSRIGVGAVRHLEVKILWLQDLVRAKRLKVVKIAGTENIADTGTKVLDQKTFERLYHQAGIRKLSDLESIPESTVIGLIALRDRLFM